jgi:transcriptional regulator GlxA family with amidase domain
MALHLRSVLFRGFARAFPDVKLQRGFRFVETDGNVATAGGLTSGIDLAFAPSSATSDAR